MVFLKWVLYFFDIIYGAHCDLFSQPPKNAGFGEAIFIHFYFSTEKNCFGGQ